VNLWVSPAVSSLSLHNLVEGDPTVELSKLTEVKVRILLFGDQTKLSGKRSAAAAIKTAADTDRKHFAVSRRKTVPPRAFATRHGANRFPSVS